MIEFLMKFVAVIAIIVFTVGLAIGGITLFEYISILSICWIVVPILAIIVLPCLIGLVAWLWSR